MVVVSVGCATALIYKSCTTPCTWYTYVTNPNVTLTNWIVLRGCRFAPTASEAMLVRISWSLNTNGGLSVFTQLRKFCNIGFAHPKWVGFCFDHAFGILFIHLRVYFRQFFGLFRLFFHLFFRLFFGRAFQCSMLQQQLQVLPS